MKKFAVAATLAVAVVFAFSAVQVLAQDAPKAVPVTVTGVNYGLLATLAKDEVEGADETCAALNALKVKEAKDADGNVIEELKGKTLHYLPNKAGSALLMGKDNRGKTVTVEGKLFADAAVLAVDSFEAAAGGDDEFGDFDELPIQSMSNQQIL